MLSAATFRRLAFLTASFAYLQIALGGVVRVTDSGLGPSTSAMAGASFRRIAALAAAATYVLLLTGSTVVASSADESCRAWPLCGNGFAFDFAGANALTMLHRGAVLLIGILLVYVLRAAIRHQATRRVAVATAIVFALQVAMGVGSALTDAAFFNGLHVAIATLVWSGMLSIALLTLSRGDRSPALSRLTVDKHPA